MKFSRFNFEAYAVRDDQKRVIGRTIVMSSPDRSVKVEALVDRGELSQLIAGLERLLAE